eukprot:TRINITY_DN19031_c0_g1_i1.p1 TRINITY_DN19031_c0_g1~~TRINITY_DN19031_c0_g1_i1.p1  ORF type:complete len:425 (+),score=47.61 TRINITY_DN19031_c0_g1_i1:55-1329(+)
MPHQRIPVALSSIAAKCRGDPLRAEARFTTLRNRQDLLRNAVDPFILREEEDARGNAPEGILSGVVVGVQENLKRDSGLVGKMEKLGARVAGVVKSPVLNLNAGAEQRLCNPWNFSRSCTSGGAAAVATGLVDVSVSAECYPTTLKNTAKTGCVGMRFSKDHLKTQKDFAKFYDFTTVSDELDALSVATRTVTDLAHLYTAFFEDDVPLNEEELKMGFVSNWGGFSENSRWELGVASDRVKGKCHTVSVSHGIFDDLGEFSKGVTNLASADLYKKLHSLGDAADELAVAKLLKDADQSRRFDSYHFAKRWRYFMSRYLSDIKADCLVSPSTPHDCPVHTNPGANTEFFLPFVLAGCPMVILPLHVTSPLGVPLSILLVGPPQKDLELIGTALRVEALLHSDADRVAPLWEREPIEVMENGVKNA